MNHSEANDSAAAAAYILHQLSDADREAFEMHYIDCPICAEEVWAGTRMLTAGLEALKSKKAPVVPFPARWFQGKAVAAMLAAVVGIQSFLLLRPAPVQIVMVGPTLIDVTRSGESKIIETVPFQDGLQTSVGIDIPTEARYPNYRIEVQDSSRKSFEVFKTTEKQVRSAQGFYLPLNPLPAGRYELVVEGVREDGRRVPAASYPFIVE